MIQTIEWKGKKIEIEDNYIDVDFVVGITNAKSEKEIMNLMSTVLKMAVQTPDFKVGKMRIKDFNEFYAKMLKEVVGGGDGQGQ